MRKVTRKTREIDCLSCSQTCQAPQTEGSTVFPWHVTTSVPLGPHFIWASVPWWAHRMHSIAGVPGSMTIVHHGRWPCAWPGPLDRWTGKGNLRTSSGLRPWRTHCSSYSSEEDFLRGLTSFSPLNFPMFSCVSCESWIWTAPHFRFFTFLQLHWALQLTGSANLWIRLNGMDAYGISIRRQPSETSLKITEIQTNTQYSTVYICGQPKSLKNIYVLVSYYPISIINIIINIHRWFHTLLLRPGPRITSPCGSTHLADLGRFALTINSQKWVV